MKDYSNMSDFEVCGYVSMHENGFSWIEFDDEMASHVKCGNEGSPGFAIVEVKDYCNNPSDAMPILIENRISLTWVNGECRASSVKAGYHEFSCGNALRAAMIVYLMMKDEEK